MAKKTTRKAPARTTKKPAARAASKPARITSAKDKPRSKSEIYAMISDHVGISRKEVAGVFDVMGEMIAADLKKNAIGSFNVPGMMKVLVQRKPATKATKKVMFGEERLVPAKPARTVVKVRPLKGLKDKVG